MLLPTLEPGGSGFAYAISDHGDVVGWSTRGAYPHATLSRGGHVRDLGTLTGVWSEAHDVNESGQIVGFWTTDGVFDKEPFLYSGGTMTSLGFQGAANAIDDKGRIVGWYEVDSTPLGPVHAFVYAGGVRTDLGTLPGRDESAANDVNRFGQIVGSSSCLSCSGVPTHAFLYANGSMTDLGTLGQQSQALGINDAGQVVGFSSTAAGSRAFVWSGGVMRDLNDLVPPIAGGTLEQASAIDDLGRIVAYGLFSDGRYHTFLLTPRHH
jgi:probable HAF family extracellular repeat protein